MKTLCLLMAVMAAVNANAELLRSLIMPEAISRGLTLVVVDGNRCRDLNAAIWKDDEFTGREDIMLWAGTSAADQVSVTEWNRGKAVRITRWDKTGSTILIDIVFDVKDLGTLTAIVDVVSALPALSTTCCECGGRMVPGFVMASNPMQYIDICEKCHSTKEADAKERLYGFDSFETGGLFYRVGKKYHDEVGSLASLKEVAE